MSFKDSAAQFQIVDLSQIEPDTSHPRLNIEEAGLKSLANSIAKMGLIHPIVVRPAEAGRYTVIVGERRRQAALLAGEKAVPVVIRACAADETLEVQVFENIGLGVRTALEARDMANAIQSIAARFASSEEAAQHFARPPTWLAQATAAANLSEKVSALLDSGRIASTGTAVQLEKLVRKNEARAESLIDQIGQLPAGEKVAKKIVDHALAEESGRRKKNAATTPPAEDAPTAPAENRSNIPAWEDAPAPTATVAPDTQRSRMNPGKVRQVAEILGLSDDDEEAILVRLIDEFLALKQV